MDIEMLRQLMNRRNETRRLLDDVIALYDEYVVEYGYEPDIARSQAVTDTLLSMVETIDLHEYLDQHPEAIP